MKKLLNLILAVMLFQFSFAQQGTIDPTFNIVDDCSYGDNSVLNDQVNSIAIQADGKMIIGGMFTSFNGTARNRIARLNVDGSLDLTFNPGIGFDSTVNAIALQTDGKIVVGGDFTSFNGNTTNYINRLNSDGTIDLSFNPGSGFNYGVGAISLQSDGKIIVGGYFTTYNGISRNKITRLNSDGSLDSSFDPGTGFNTTVNSIAIQTDGKLLIGGGFTSFNGIGRNRIARLNTDGSLDTLFNPGTGFNGSVVTVAIQIDGKIIVGGSFTTFNGNTRKNITRLNLDGTLDTSFNIGIGFDAWVNSIAIQSDGKIIVGGNFSSYDGITKNKIARLTSTGSLDLSYNFGVGFDTFVISLALKVDDKLIVGGWFTSYDGILRKNIAKLNADGSLDTSFKLTSGFDAQVNSIAVQTDGKIVVGGWFTSYNGTSRNRIARLNTDGSLDTLFDPGLGFNDMVSAIAIQPDGKIIASGYFTSFNGTSRHYIARLNTDGTLDNTFIANPNYSGSSIVNFIQSIAIQTDGKIIVGGWFSSFDGVPRSKIARLNTDGTLDVSFISGSSFYYVYSTKLQPDGKIIVVGWHNYTSTASTTSNKIARLNSDGSLDTSFIVGTGYDTYITVTDIQPDGKIIIGGKFTTINGTGRNQIARLNSDCSLDTSFDPGSGFNEGVSTIKIQPDGKIIVGGDFTLFNGTERKKLARLNSDGSLDLSFSPGTGPDNGILCAAIHSDGKIIVGGNFTTFDGICRNRIARLSACYETVSITSVSECNSFTWSSNGITYTTSGVYTDTLTNFYGCDSIATLNLTIINSANLGSETITACDAFTWPSNGTTYNISGTYTVLLTNICGYDSVATLHLTIHYSNTELETVVACDTYTWLANGITYPSSGTYTANLTNSYGCDSIVTLNLTINNSTSGYESVTACDSFTWSTNGTTYTSSGTYIDTLTNINGCDSITSLNLTINHSFFESELVTACDSYSWSVNGTTYTTSGSYTASFTTINDCDSNITLILTVNHSDTGSESITACDSYTWIANGTTFSTSGIYTATLTNVNGCDSIATLNLTIISTQETVLTNCFVTPSDQNSCVGEAAIDVSGNMPIELYIDNVSVGQSFSGYLLTTNLCSGVHDLMTIGNCNDTLITQFVIPVDPNFVFNNPFIDSLAQDSLGTTITDCDIYYNAIDTAYIDSIWANGNTVTVIWNIIDSNGSNFDTSSYVLNNGNGVYWLQLSVFCPNKSIESYFTVTEAIYFNNGTVSTAGLENYNLHQIGLYPNPAQNNVTVNFDENLMFLRIIDIQNKLILHKEIMSGEKISLAEFEAGCYLFEFISNNGRVIKRVVKQ